MSDPPSSKSTAAAATPDEPARYALVSTWRFVVPLAILVGVAAGFGLGGAARWICWLGTLVIIALWLVGRAARPTLVLAADGYRVEEGGRERLRVPFADVRRARAVPAERAMYVDCGDPAKNLLLPPRRGYGFRFERQGEIYVRLARALGDRVEIVDRLESPPQKNDSGSGGSS